MPGPDQRGTDWTGPDIPTIMSTDHLTAAAAPGEPACPDQSPEWSTLIGRDPRVTVL